MRASTEKNILYFYDGFCEPIYSGYFSSEAVCKAFSRCTLHHLKQPPSLAPPQTVSFKGRVLECSTRGQAVSQGSQASEPPPYLWSYFHDTTIRIAHIFMNHFSEKWIAIIGISVRKLVDPGTDTSLDYVLKGTHQVDWLSITMLQALEAILVSVDVYTWRSQQSIIKRDLQWSRFTRPWTCTKSSIRVQERRVGRTLAI